MVPTLLPCGLRGSAQARDAQQLHGAGDPLLLRPASPLCKVPAASWLDGGVCLWVREFDRRCCCRRGLWVFPLKREVSVFVRGKRAEAWRLPRARPVPAPKSCARGCRWPVLPPSVPPSCHPRCRTLAPPPPSQLLKAIVSIACSSLLRSRCLRACSSFSNAAKIWGERRGERVRRCLPT